MELQKSFDTEVERLIRRVQSPPVIKSGILARVVGLTLEARGVIAPVGAFCEVVGADDQVVEAEVVGFHDNTLYLMPFADPTGVAPGAEVRIISPSSKSSVGQDMLGRVLDGRGAPLDGRPPPYCPDFLPAGGIPINPMQRGPIDQVLDVGVKAINGLLTMGRGQRIGLVAGSGVGKSVLLGMLTKFTKADVVVIGLIGERGREVREFISDSLGSEGLNKSVVIAAPANVSPLLRLKATEYAHLTAEYFRDQGKNVLLLLDSLTRVAHAQREIGLAIGEPPTARGYPPSVFGLIPKLIERAGVGKFGFGSISAIYTVLAENDDPNDPVVDIARASLDGQVMLSRDLADAAHYPAIDLKGSISRVMQSIVKPKVLDRANRIRRLWSLYQDNQDLIQVGAYEKGSNPELDTAIDLRDQVSMFLRQDMNEGVDYETTTSEIRSIFGA